VVNCAMRLRFLATRWASCSLLFPGASPADTQGYTGAHRGAHRVRVRRKRGEGGLGVGVW